ncbi:MAG: class I SAM-dependent rRNA methyltransferase, partial [Phycisphaerae bacterium]
MKPTDQNNANRATPWVELRSVAYKTLIFKKMIGASSPDANPGSVVNVYDRRGKRFGIGLYNPKSILALRMLNFGEEEWDNANWPEAINRACSLRLSQLNLQNQTDAFRLIHAEGDALSGLTADLYQDVLSIVIYSAGMWHQREHWLPPLLEASKAKHYRLTFDESSKSLEQVAADVERSDDLPKQITLQENGIRFSVNFELGHKTGFFCDQRENRLQLSRMVAGTNVLDLCCFSGGFGIYAKKLGDASEVHCVDLDEDAVELAKRNANLNQVRVNTVHADAFTYMRQMASNYKTFGVVVLDPPKLIAGRKDFETGLHKYRDMNRLAA